MSKGINQQVTGSHTATVALSAAFQYFEHLRNTHGPIVSGHFGSGLDEAYISFMTPAMEEIIQREPSFSRPGFQTDFVEGFVTASFWRGELYVCMSSMWIDEVRGMMPACITILFSKTANASSLH